jgi:hypothetical protein
MPTKRCLFAALLAGGALCAQSQTSPPAPEAEKPGTYVRRLSIGATLSVIGLGMMPDRGSTNVTTIPPVNATYTTSGDRRAVQRIGYGVTAQLSLNGHFALSAGVFRHRFGYEYTSDIYTGLQDPNSLTDTRTHTVTDENTTGWYLDLPATVRYYTKERHSPGPRAFLELGGVIRRTTKISTAIDTTIDEGATSCCVTTPITPAHPTVQGYVGGFGMQFIDPFGIRVVPEVRYTRWRQDTFQSVTTMTGRNQVEAMISLTF